MSGELHEISRALGALEANTTALLAGQKELTDTVNTIVPTVQSISQWVEQEGKPAVKAMRRAKHIAVGAVGVSALGSSPSWLPKLTAFMHIIFP